MDIERVVQSGRRARHRDSLLSRQRAPDEAREEDDARCRGRHLVRMHGHPPPRGGPCHPARLSIAAPPALAAAVWPVLKTLPALLPAQSGEPAICPASSALVRAEPSGRGFRRNLRGVATAALELADALCRLAGAEEARICRRADGGNRRQTAGGHDAGARRSVARAQPDAWRALPEEAGVLRLQAAEDLRPRSPAAVFRRSTASPVATGIVLHQAAPRPYQTAGGSLDGRESAYTGCRA